MVVGEVAEGVDLLVVGAGPGGYTAALRAAALGRSVLLVDRLGDAGIGGVCLQVGCIPSKALIEVAEVAHRSAGFADAGLTVGEVSVDLARFQEWKAVKVGGLTGGVAELLRRAGVEVAAGEFRFTRPGSGVLQSADDRPPRHLEYTDVVLATGSRPVELPGLPRDGERVLSSTDALALSSLPASIAVVGGGYIGLELGTAFAKLGATVTLVEATDRLLPGVDAALLRPVRQRLRAVGVEVLLGHRVEGLADGVLTATGDSGEVRVAAEKVIVAIGRRPNTDGLGLARIGITPDERGLIPVGPDRMAAPHVAAIGDITAGPALAHKATAEGEVAAEALCGRPAAFDPAAIPAVVFSDPEIAVAGYSADEARALGMDVAVARLPLSASGRAATMGAVEGFTQLVVDRSVDAVVGVHIVGPHASELIAEGVLAIEMAASPVDLLASIHPHPTLSEMTSDVARVLLHQPAGATVPASAPAAS
ncbi:dihydrolipoyl dehydrogenase [Blastococcus xanthinilyticus]|uniref:Dihydrolipoyl dehydrogenase n=1 Tax=Blastococcus xanthinilyticus TaxID=1564164 RepID=A0A5S5D0V0_9ACTN|nr:dihydrolipoyl dehydrogenase [Blastococcus xanthinilyticus]TYP88878.1 dihydrolipoamide dehydrogenase [Blastococcus xanthinilyticus]